MAMEKQRRLVSLLFQKSMRGELEWGEAIQKNSFQVSLAKNSISIRSTPSRLEESANDYVFSIHDSEGKVVDTFTDVEVAEKIEGREGKARFYSTVSELYEVARRTALGSEKVLNEILTELGDDEIPF